MNFAADPDTPLLKLTPSDAFTLRDAFNGVHIFGAIGSGKTSGSGKALARAYLRAGMGGLVLCAKPEEVELWQRYAEENGRASSVILFDERLGFNFIDYELSRQGLEYGVSNVVECLNRVLEAADQATGKTNTSSDSFWPQSTEQVLKYVIPVIYAAQGSVTVANIIDFVTTAAPDARLYGDPGWAANSYAARTLRAAVDRPVIEIRDSHMMQSLASYWFQQFPNIPEKTRGNILISLSARLDRFRHGRLRKVFCDQTDLVPELSMHGAIIIMAMPNLGVWNEDGRIAQQLFKFVWQRAIESRNGLAPPHRDRPVFLWADEAQYFVNLKDADFISTCRGSRACVVFLSQTLPNYYKELGERNQHAANSLVGKFNTMVFHLNACHHTNQYAADLIGKRLQLRRTTNESVGSNYSRGMNYGENSSQGTSSGGGSTYSSGPGGSSSGYSSNSGTTSSYGSAHGQNVGSGSNESSSWGTTEQMDYLLEPSYFASHLKNGGPRNGNLVSAVWFKAGGRFHATEGDNVIRTTFKQ